MMNKKRKFFSAAFTLTGTIIGAGILGLPYVFAKAGFFIGLFWLIFLGLILLFVGLCMGEITLRTKKIYQLPGYSNKYLGKWGGRVMFVAIIFGIYSALLAYLIGEGQSLSKLFTGGVEYAFIFGIGFWMIMTYLLKGGLERLKNIGFFGVIAVIIIITLVFLILLPEVKIENINYVNSSNFFIPFGVVLFSLLGLNSIPELRREIEKDKKIMKKAIIFGASIPIILYLMFTLVFVGVFGGNVAEIATLSFTGVFGKFLLLLGICTMMTCFFILSFALRDCFIFDLRNKKVSFFYVSLVPLLLYILVNFFNLAGFVQILGLGGAVSGGIMGILILFMNRAAKKKGDVKPEYSIKINWFIIGFLSLVFLAGILFEIF